MKSTLTALLALVLVIVAVCVALSNMDTEAKKTTSAKISKLEVKTTSGRKNTEPKPGIAEFGLTASFGPQPEN